MRFQSNVAISEGSYAPIRLDRAFPVSLPDFQERSSTPEIKPHIHDCLEIGYCYDGTGVFIVEEKILPYKKGDALLINNHEVHITAANPGGVTRWGFLNFDQIGLLSANAGSDERFLEADSLSGAGFENIINCDQQPEICSIIKSIIEERAEQADGYQSMIRSRVWSLMILLHRLYANRKHSAVIPDRHEKLSRITPALKLIAENFSREISLNDLAASCNTSESNFRKLFHKAAGCSPQEYVKQVRLKAAAVLLTNSRQSILDIALSTGYSTLSNFNRQFLDFYGVSPRAWRKTLS